ncbi:hypothetical protein ACHAWX_004960, partial [Stephanocyclus meneghinianus]
MRRCQGRKRHGIEACFIGVQGIILLRFGLLSNAQIPYSPTRCPERSRVPTVVKSTVSSWSDLKDLLESLPPSTKAIVLPSFQIKKQSSEPPIFLNSSLAISCVSEGACILKASRPYDAIEGGGGGTYFEIQGEYANVWLTGFTFMNASTGAIIIAKNAGESRDNVILEQMICESYFLGNQGRAGAAIAAYAKTKIHIESCTFSQNLAFGSSDSSNDYDAVGGVVYNAAEVMSILFSTFDDNSSQIGVIYTGPKSTLLISQNTFILGDNQRQYEGSTIYVYAEDEENVIDDGGNRGYDSYFDNGKVASYCSGIYVNNEDECRAFADIPLKFTESNMELMNGGIHNMSSRSTCSNTVGVFRNHLGDLKRCLWLLNGLRRSLNCHGLTELGRMCRKACQEDCDSSSNHKGIKKDRRRRKREKIMKRRKRKRESKLSTGEVPLTKSPSQLPTDKTERPTIKAISPPSMTKPTKSTLISSYLQHEDTDLVFYVIGDAPYKVTELDPTTGFPHQVRGIPDDAEFVVHVGDILSAKESGCHQSWYQQVSQILKESNAPVFITPGDNDWLDCEPYIGAKVAFQQWQDTFDSFHSSWSPNIFDVQHQPSIKENMAFVHKRVLFLVLHLVSDYYDIQSERMLRHKSQLSWANEQISTHKSSIDAMVIIGHSPPSPLNRDFFSQKEGGIATTINTLNIPVVYIHGSGHKFVEEEQFNSVDNFLRIQIPGRHANPVRVSFDRSKRFYFDFNDDSILTQC